MMAAATGYDSTLVQTREKESEQERHKETETETATDRADDDGIAGSCVWDVAMLRSVSEGATVPLLQPLSALRFCEAGPCVAFPPSLLVSQNHSQSWHPLAAGPLKDVVLLCALQGALGPCVCIVNLLEAESVRRACHVLHPVTIDLNIQLLHTDGAVVDDVGHSASEAEADACLCARLYNCELWYSPQEISRLLCLLAGTPPPSRQAFFDDVMTRRIRTLSQWRGTSVEQVLTRTGAEEYGRLVSVFTDVRSHLDATFPSLSAAFKQFDVDQVRCHGAAYRIAYHRIVRCRLCVCCVPYAGRAIECGGARDVGVISLRQRGTIDASPLSS